jgi:hypothetical protein
MATSLGMPGVRESLPGVSSRAVCATFRGEAVAAGAVAHVPLPPRATLPLVVAT